ncbi:unnamed protein product [Anisakis simplex]|uniref:Microtubule-associated protein futsch (inferred by orthology to a D. melanogaster protein) n=1 Tax=Anisakis simplex TaxID=6269 RepID=A0A0M3J921_ANISI|nr:unnamed protein product [Anisakis simplex]
MIVLNPERGSKELSALWGAIKSGENIEKHAAACSLAAVFVWHPADTSKPTIRILYPGACPLEKLYTALEKLKGEEYLRYLDYASANREKYIMSGHANNRPPAHHAPSSGPAHKPLAQAKPLAKSAAAAATATAPATARATKRPTKPTSLASRPATGSSRTTTTTTTTSTTSAGHTKTTTTKATTETAAKKVTK